MTDDPLEAALRTLRPRPGPTPEGVAFRGGALQATRQLRRRYRPMLSLASALAVAGWGAAAFLALREPLAPFAPPTPAPPPPWVGPADYPVPAAWRARLDQLDRLDAEGLSALGPDPGPAAELPFPNLEDLR